MKGGFARPCGWLVAAISAFVAVLSHPAQAQQRTVNFYNWSNYVAPGVLEDFTREYGERHRY